MDFKGTKGEWKCTPISNFSDTIVSFIGTDDKPIAQLRGCETGEEKEAMFNAQLIASAPTMFEALIEIANKLDSEEMNVNSKEFKLWKIANDALGRAVANGL
jgi:hypothetical protein